MRYLIAVCVLALSIGASANAATVKVPSGFTVPATQEGGVSFVANGKITQGSKLSLSISGTPFLESNPIGYGTNAAGVIVVAGTHAKNEKVGNAITGNAVHGVPLYYGALIVAISSGTTTYYGQILPPGRAEGRRSRTPPTTLVFNGTLKAIFKRDTTYAPFRFTNPTLTFFVEDNAGQYNDNTGQFSLANTTKTQTAN